MTPVARSSDVSAIGFAIFVILHTYSWWHLGRLHTLKCLRSCNVQMDRYRKLLRVELGLAVVGAALAAYTAQCPDDAKSTLAPLAKHPRAVLFALFALIAAFLFMHAAQWRTLRELRRCACVRESDVDLATTLLSAERLLKMTMAVVNMVTFLLLTRKLARAGMV